MELAASSPMRRRGRKKHGEDGAAVGKRGAAAPSLRAPQESREHGCKKRRETVSDIYISSLAGVMELADVLDSKSSPGDRVRVRPPPPAPSFVFGLVAQLGA